MGVIAPTKENTDEIMLPALSTSFKQSRPLPNRIVEFEVETQYIDSIFDNHTVGYDDDDDDDDDDEDIGCTEQLEDIQVLEDYNVHHFETLRRRIFFGNLPYNLTEEGLRNVLERFGDVENVWIFKPPVHRKKFIQMSDSKFQEMYSKALLLEENEDREENILGDENADSDIVEGVDDSSKVLKRIRKTLRRKAREVAKKRHTSDTYAFVDMADWEGFDEVIRPDVTQFGIAFGFLMSKISGETYQWKDLIVELEVDFCPSIYFEH